MRAERRGDVLWISLICGYAVLGALLRPLYGAGMSYDEAEAFYYARDLRLGYDAQPPLYFWLQWVFFQVFGETVFAVGLLKAATLALFGCGLYGLLREQHPPQFAGPGVAMLALLPDVLWRAQRALTHSVLALGLTVLATWLLWRALRDERMRSWAWFGLAIGLGMISKWNYLLVPVALLITALWIPQTRKSISVRGVALAAAIASAVVTGPVIWTLANFERATNTLDKLGFDEGAIPPLLAAPLAMLVTLAAVAGLLLIVVGMMTRSLRGRPWAPALPLDRFLGTLVVVGVLLLFAVMLVTGSTRMQNHWMLPLVYLVAPLAALRFVPRLGPPGRRRLTGWLAAIWGGAVLMLFYEGRVDPGWRGLDYAVVAESIGDNGAANAAIATNEIRLAGILPLFLAGRAVYYLPDDPVLPLGPIVWITMPKRDGDVTAKDLAQERGRTVVDETELLLPRGFRTTRFDLATSR